MKVLALLLAAAACDAQAPAPRPMPDAAELDPCALAPGSYVVGVQLASSPDDHCPALASYSAISPTGGASFLLPLVVNRADVQAFPGCIVEASAPDGAWSCWIDPVHRDGGCSYSGAGAPCLYDLSF